MSREREAILRLADVVDILIREVDLHVYPDDFNGIVHLNIAVDNVRELLTSAQEGGLR